MPKARSWSKGRARSPRRSITTRRSRSCTSGPVPTSRSRRCVRGSRPRASSGRSLKEGVLERVGSTVTPQPVLAVARKPEPSTEWLARDGLVVVGVELGDPGNVGTLLRSAEASGGGGNRAESRIRRCVQSQGRTCVSGCDLRGSRDGGVVRGGGARRARRARPAAVGCCRRYRHSVRRRRLPPPDRGGARQRGPRPGRRAHRPPRRPRHHSDGRVGGVAQRRDGGHRAVLRVRPSARGGAGHDLGRRSHRTARRRARASRAPRSRARRHSTSSRTSSASSSAGSRCSPR